MLIKPEALKTGNNILVFLASSPIKKKYLESGIEKLENLGFSILTVPEILEDNGLLAKPPKNAFKDLQNGFNNPDIDVLWAGRGGYGANYLLPLLKDLSISSPKILIGSSDVSYLLWYILDKLKMVVFYGPMICSSIAKSEFNQKNLLSILTGNYSQITIKGKVLNEGKAKGILTGGCLTNLVSLIGTDFFPVLNDRILFIEDIKERPYKIDRMIWQLKNSNQFSKIKGLIIGEFRDSFIDFTEKNDLYKRIKDHLKYLHIPIITDLPIGHSKNIHTLPLGVEVEIDTKNFAGMIIKEKGVIK